MIGKLRGHLETSLDDSVIIDVNGVGYHVFCSSLTLRSLPSVGETTLLIETHVREDHIHLFGFKEEAERHWFRTLTTVSGVGNKVAIAILSVLSPAQLATAIAAQDKAAFKQVSGVGLKLAERIITELKSKVKGLGVAPSPVSINTGKQENNHVADAISALTNLGYDRSRAYDAVQKSLSHQPQAETPDLIRHALKELAK